MKERKIEIFFVCPMCGKEHSIKYMPVSLVDRVEHRRQTGEYIQDFLRDYSKFDREKFITG